MLIAGRALDHREAVDTFVARHKELQKFDLTDADWAGLTLVTEWLKSFRSATTQMSTTKRPMLSTTHAIFRGLQDHIKNILANLPQAATPRIKRGFLNAHRKLSDYYTKFDESPFYTWSACQSTFLPVYIPPD